MKVKLLASLLIFSHTISAQLAITPNAQLTVAGNMQLSLENSDLLNNGNFVAGTGKVTFSGNASSSIGGSEAIQFFELEMSKSNNSSVRLDRTIGVSQRILFSSGFLDLNSFDADLGTTAHLDGENENTRIIGPKGGEVLFNVNLNSPANSNPANLGVFITSNRDLGYVTIKRGYQSQSATPGSGSSVLRYYDILPANNSNLNATLQFRYFDGELNGLDENAIEFFESRNAIDWSSLGFSSRDIASNLVERNGLSSLGRITLSRSNNTLAGYKSDQSSYTANELFRVWPNPVSDIVYINIEAGNESPAIINVFDSKGGLVKRQQAAVLKGGNQLSVDMRSLVPGVYSVSVGWNNGDTKKTVQVLKR